MQIIISHNHLDFDGLSCMVAAKKLYPRAEMVFSGGLSGNVQRFMSLHKDSLPIKRFKDITLANITQVVVVDTNSPRRLGEFSDWIDGAGIDVHVYDHHPMTSDTLPASCRLIDTVGSATTLMVEKLQEKGMRISGFEATVMALGLYEDTGSMTFISTTPRDIRAAAYLLECGANLSVVANFIEQIMTDEQKALFNRLLASVTHLNINGIDLLIAVDKTEKSIGNLDQITQRLSDLETYDVLLVLVQMDKKIYMVARSKTEFVSVSEVCAAFGGGGHPKAASATIRDKTLTELLEDLYPVLQDKLRPPVLARDIMSSPVKTVSPSLSMEEAGKIMLRYGHTGLPVLEDNRLVGVISRRDVDKAKIHNLGHAPVKGYMARKVVSAHLDTPLGELQHLLVKYDVGRLPIVDEKGGLLGLVSRTDVLRTFHGMDYPEDHQLIYDDKEPVEPVSSSREIRALISESLPAPIQELLQAAGEVGRDVGMNVYAVGGFVRDLLLGKPNLDLDLTVEGSGPDFARELAERMRAEVRIHERFGTAVVIMPNGQKIDVATARVEYYEYPAALPHVESSSVRQDLYRRDFTVNAMAIQLNSDRFGELIDFFGGLRDLKQGLIRILYNLSFVEDPTRIIRAIRFEQRYGFDIEPQTQQMLQDAVERNYLRELSYKRIREELLLILEERDPRPALRRLENLGIMAQIAPEVVFDQQIWRNLGRVPKAIEAVQKAVGSDNLYNIDSRAVYWLVLFSPTEPDKAGVTVERFQLNRRTARMMRDAYQIEYELNQLGARAATIPMSTLNQIIGGTPLEIIAYLMARTASRAWQNQILEYLRLRADLRPSLNGEDLKQLGMKPGPDFRDLLDLLRDARLDGKVRTREDEIAMVREWRKRKEETDAF
ncbi:MAG: CBS domain-containing protein [Firmicutes bacterium]|nr:CBS domain-containing protein [Bacillota bacterium]